MSYCIYVLYIYTNKCIADDVLFFSDPMYSDYDLEPDEFVPDQDDKTVDQSDKPTMEGSDRSGSGNDYKEMPPHPPLYVPSMKKAEYFNPVYNRTQPGVTRTCRKAVDLYVLQPNRLNMSGSFNPLKGKLTNCHATGCERLVVYYVPYIKIIATSFKRFLV